MKIPILVVLTILLSQPVLACEPHGWSFEIRLGVHESGSDQHRDIDMGESSSLLIAPSVRYDFGSLGNQRVYPFASLGHISDPADGDPGQEIIWFGAKVPIGDG